MDSAIKELHQLRDSGLRVSSRILELWTSSLSGFIDKLGNEKWVTLEQVFIAALDGSDMDTAKKCLNTLQLKFPRSARVNRLLGMFLESQNRYEEAHTLYTSIIETDPTDTIARKRLVAILKAQGQTNEAIDELNIYLKFFMADTEAWGELADLYLAQGDFKHAAFCVEELILANPHNHLLHQRLAEIKYTEGGAENLSLACSYFAQACVLNPYNLRAIYGLLLVSSTLSGMSVKSANLSIGIDSSNQKALTSLSSEEDCFGPTSSRSAKQENISSTIWSSKQIRKIYEKSNVELPYSNCTLKLCDKLSEKHPISESANSDSTSSVRLRAPDDDVQIPNNRTKVISITAPVAKNASCKKSQ